MHLVPGWQDEEVILTEAFKLTKSVSCVEYLGRVPGWYKLARAFGGGVCLLCFCSTWEGLASNSHAVKFFLPWFYLTHPDSPEFKCKLFSVAMTCDFSLWKCNHVAWPFDLGSTAASCTFRRTCQRWDSNCTWNSQEGCFFIALRSNHFHTHYFQLNFQCLLPREVVLCWAGLLLRPEMSMFTVWIA